MHVLTSVCFILLLVNGYAATINPQRSEIVDPQLSLPNQSINKRSSDPAKPPLSEQEQGLSGEESKQSEVDNRYLFLKHDSESLLSADVNEEDGDTNPTMEEPCAVLIEYLLGNRELKKAILPEKTKKKSNAPSDVELSFDVADDPDKSDESDESTKKTELIKKQHPVDYPSLEEFLGYQPTFDSIKQVPRKSIRPNTVNGVYIIRDPTQSRETTPADRTDPASRSRNSPNQVKEVIPAPGHEHKSTEGYNDFIYQLSQDFNNKFGPYVQPLPVVLPISAGYHNLYNQANAVPEDKPCEKLQLLLTKIFEGLKRLHIPIQVVLDAAEPQEILNTPKKVFQQRRISTKMLNL